MSDLARNVLGSLLLGIGNPADFSPEDFVQTDHRAIFRAMARISGKISTPLVASVLERTDPGISAPHELAGLTEFAVASSNLPGIVAAFREERRRREFRLATERLLQHLDSDFPTDDARTIVQELDRLSRPTGTRSATHVRDGLAEIFTRGELPHVPLGIARLTDFRIVPGNLTVIGARPGVGKTAMLGTIALAAARAGWRALLVSLEMSALEIRQRLLAGAAEVSMTDIQHSVYSPKLTAAATELGTLDLWIEDEANARIDLEAIGDLVRAFAAHQSVILVDYLQLVTTRARFERRYEQIGHVCRELKHLAVTHGVPIIVAAQLSRGAEQHAKPQLSDLRESGEIEQTADKVMFIHRDGEECALRVAKYRQGPTFNCSVRYIANQCRFDDPDGF